MQLALSGVSYTYPAAPSPILSNISITFPQGWTGLLGDNGCGKSTLARIRLQASCSRRGLGHARARGGPLHARGRRPARGAL